MPLNITKAPYGFLANYQAFRLDYMSPDESCKNLVLKMKDKHELRSKLQDSVIQSFIDSKDYPQAIARSKVLDEFGPYNSAQANAIIRGSLKNNQIYRSVIALDTVKEFFSRNEGAIEDNLKKQFQERIRSS